jgi:hypothetical protein
MVQARRSRSSFSPRAKPIKLPKKKAFCSVCKHEFPLDELTKVVQGWICDPCLAEK